MKNIISKTENSFLAIAKNAFENVSSIQFAIAFLIALFSSSIAKGQLTVNLTPSNVNCQGLKNGQVTAHVTGGTPPYQYKWSNGASTQSISNLNPGYFHCIVFDYNNVKAEAEITLTEPEVMRIVQFDATVYSNNFNTSCYTCNDGAITVAVSGGTPPYSYLWSDGSTQQNRTNLIAKDYQLVVTDAFGCQVRELNKELSKPERDDWTANGNSNATLNSFIGTTNAMPLVLKAGNQEGLRLLTNKDALFSGKIGIGTTTPTEKLDIEGGIRVRGINSNYSTIPFATGETRLVSTDASGNLKDEYVDVRGGTNCTKKVLGWSARPSLNLSMAYSTPSGVTVYPPDLDHPDDIIKCPQAGNVGIGVLQPNFKVDVDGDVNATGYRLNGNPVNFSQWSNNGTTIYYNGGNVGIGTNNTGSFKLAVDGKIGAREFKVTSTNPWPDYVFEKSRGLLPIADLQKYITANKHLPGMPSANEIEREYGFDVGKTQLLTLEKVEELYLYVLQQQIKIERLQDEITKLKK